MNEDDKGLIKTQAEQRAWEKHNLSQLMHFRSLSLREKLEALQGMADVVRRLHEMRARGELQAPPQLEERDALPSIDRVREPDARSS